MVFIFQVDIVPHCDNFSHKDGERPIGTKVNFTFVVYLKFLSTFIKEFRKVGLKKL